MNESIMQFTGLKDKKGKEIYEGDIVNGKGKTKPFVVEWRDDTAGYATKLTVGVAVHWAFVAYMKDAEVIGNIYEHPELLK